MSKGKFVNCHNKFFLFILLLGAGFLLLSCSRLPSKITEIAFIDRNQNSTSTTDEKEIELFQNAIREAYSSDSLSAVESVTERLIFNSENGNKQMPVFLDPYRKSIVLYDEERAKAYLIQDETAKELLSAEMLQQVYLREMIPTVSVEVKGRDYPIEAGSCNFSYKKANGEVTSYHREETIMGPEIPTLLSADTWKLSSDKPADRMTCYYKKGDQTVLIHEIEEGEAIPVPQEDGEYETFLIMEFDEKSESLGWGTLEYQLKFTVDNPITAVLTQKAISPGHILGIRILNANPDEEIMIKSSLKKTPLKVVKSKGSLSALLEVPMTAKPKIHTLSIETMDKKVILEETFEIQKRTFQRHDLWITEQLASVRSEENVNNDSKYTSQARKTSNPEPYWEGLFQWPLKGEHGAGYGRIRYVNGVESYRHVGIDISGEKGTPIIAAHSGKVVLAMELVVTGNTVIIDHGMNLFTSYSHMDTLAVETGDRVTQGEVLGTVGSTGFSTGPHLHWAAVLNGVYIDPEYLVNQELP